MAQTALSPTRIQSVGSMTPFMFGIAGGSGTSTTVTLPIPSNAIILGVACGSCTSATGAFCATITSPGAQTFVVTTASNDLFWWIAYIKGAI